MAPGHAGRAAAASGMGRGRNGRRAGWGRRAAREGGPGWRERRAPVRVRKRKRVRARHASVRFTLTLTLALTLPLALALAVTLALTWRRREDE